MYHYTEDLMDGGKNFILFSFIFFNFMKIFILNIR